MREFAIADMHGAQYISITKYLLQNTIYLVEKCITSLRDALSNPMWFELCTLHLRNGVAFITESV